jgi:hypothetical protein
MVIAQLKILSKISQKKGIIIYKSSVEYRPYLWAMVPNIELEVSLYMLHSQDDILELHIIMT